jgi:hypothetical protein
LYLLTEYKGLVGFMREFSREIEDNDGILLCEYSRVAATFDNFFGVPTLGLDNERVTDYAQAIEAWASLMEDDPDRPAYFITPFQPPLSEHLEFVPLRAGRHVYPLLRTSTRLPRSVADRTLELTLYKVVLRHDQAEPAPAVVFPYARPLGPGNMGLRGFARMRGRTWKSSGKVCAAGSAVNITFPEQSFPEEVSDLLLFFYVPSESPPAPKIETANGTPSGPGQWMRLVDSWWLYHWMGKFGDVPGDIIATAQCRMLLTDIHFVRDGKVRTTGPPIVTGGKEGQWRAAMRARWSRAEAGILMPLAKMSRGFILLYAKPSAANRSLRGSSDVFPRDATFYRLQSRWQWFSFLVEAEQTPPCCTWTLLSASPPWNPDLPRWPKDLGVLVAHAIAVPAPAGAGSRQP